MYHIQPYTGAELPSKCLCLTYDDGPGKDTYDIAKFLYDQNIQATFFVVGKYAFHHQDILEKVSALGHLIGNHTYEHPDMPYYLSVNGDVVSQILRTDAIIRKYSSDNTVYFRSPYGKWSQEVADELNLNFLSTINHIGPINWDIAGIDCLYWKNGESVDNAVSQYLSDIYQKDRGIVVMHDEIADMDYLKKNNSTLELTIKLIPLLKEQGYKFVRLDEIESIKRDASQRFKFKLKGTNGKFVSLSSSDTTMNVDGKENTILNELSVEDLGHGKVALRASNGLFFSLQENDGNAIVANGKDINTLETFDLIPFSSNQIAFRAYNGNYLSKENRHGGRLFAAATYMRGCEQFSFIPVHAKIKKNITFRERYKSVKRKILYIKSKVQQGV